MTRLTTIIRGCTLACGMALALATTPAAALFDDNEARRAILDLRRVIESQQQEFTRRLDEITRRLDRIEADAAPKSSQLTLQSEIGSLREDLDRLRGQIEVQTNEVSAVQRRLQQLGDQAAQGAEGGDGTGAAAATPLAAIDPNEKRAFDAALAQFRAGDFRGALVAFQSFQSQYPRSANLAQAQYWVGSSQFALRDYRAVVASQQALVRNYPDNPRVPDALLTVANAQVELNEKRAARATLQQIIDRYGSTPAAEMAKERLTELR